MLTAQKAKSKEHTAAQCAVLIAATSILAGCGGGGGGDDEPPPAFLQQRITVAELAPDCQPAGRSCVGSPIALMDQSGEATIFWQQTGSQAGWHVAVNDVGSQAVRTHALVSSDLNLDLQPVALGNKRFAAVNVADEKWSSALVDLSSPTAPSVSGRVVTSLDYSAALISGLDGAFAVGPRVPNGPVGVGGNVTVQGVNRPLPDGYFNLWWGTIEDGVGLTPTALWAFNAAKADQSAQSVQYTRVDLLTGAHGEIVDVPGWVNVTTYVSQCGPRERKKLAIQHYGRGQVAVGWVNNRSNTQAGCDIVVNGSVMNLPTSSGVGLPVMGGSDAGPVAVWQEYDLASSSGSRVMWRRTESASGWSAPAPISDHAFSNIIASATSPNGILAIAWNGCRTSFVDTCAGFVSKYERGAWTTTQFSDQGAVVGFGSAAVTWNGQAIVVWTDDINAKCSSNKSKTCPKVMAYRF